MTKSDGITGVSPRRRCAPFLFSKRTRPRLNHGPILEAQLSALQFPKPSVEFRFHPTRRWRFDFAWPDQKLALEIEGGVYVVGAHTRGAHFEGDCEKYAEALVLGWRVLRVTPRHIKGGRALAWLEKAMK